MTDDRTPLGRAVEKAREAQNLSVRAAAERAGFSEGRWRQIVQGYQKTGGHQVPANPRRRTVIAMAGAVGLDVNEALRLAGFDPIPDSVPSYGDPADYVSHRGNDPQPHGMDDAEVIELVKTARRLADELERRIGAEPMEGPG